jgi:hypothetical protein
VCSRFLPIDPLVFIDTANVLKYIRMVSGGFSWCMESPRGVLSRSFKCINDLGGWGVDELVEGCELDNELSELLTGVLVNSCV